MRERVRVAALTVAVVAGLLPAIASPASAQAIGEPMVPGPAAQIPCYDDDGPRVAVYYLYAEGQPDDLAARRSVIRDAAAQLEAVVDASARRTGGVRHVRFRTSGDCSLVIRSVAVDKADPAANLAQLVKDGLLLPGDTALAFVGPTLGFGAGATQPVDDRAGAPNVANSGGQLAAVGFALWGSIEGGAAMLARSLGALQRTAPHASGSGGCTDGDDPLCFDDLTIGEPVTSSCPAWGRYLLDCGGDDYFSTAPAAGSWLASHWNLADSVFLSSQTPPRQDLVEDIGVTIEGVPEDGRIGPQTPLTVRVSNTAPLEQVALVSSRSPGIQPLTISGSTATGSLRSLASTGSGQLFALATDKLGRQRISAVRTVTYVRGGTLTLGAPGSALSGLADYAVDLDLSGDQTGTTRLLVFRPRVGDVEPIVLADVPVVAGTTRYTGTVDTTKLPDGDAQQIVLVLADAAGEAVPGSQTSLLRTVSNSRPALRLDVTDGQVLTGTTSLTAAASGPVTSVRFVQTTTDCASGRVLGTATAAPFTQVYDPAADWRGPESRWSLCARAQLADGSSTTVGPVTVSSTQPDSVDLALAPGTVLTVGLNKIPIVVRNPSHRKLRAVQLLETSTLLGKGGHFVLSNPVADGALPTSVDVVVPPGAVGQTDLYVRAVFADGEGEFLRSQTVPVSVVVGPAPTITVSQSRLPAGGKVLVSGTAPPGSELRVYAVSRPSTTYKLVRYGTVPLDGKYSVLLGPTVNGRIYAEVVGGRSSAALPVEVAGAVTMSVARTAPMTYRFTGAFLPKRAGVRISIARRTATGGILVAQAITGTGGTWTTTKRFTARTSVELFAVSSADGVNAQGRSAYRPTTIG